jgi:hypothetical protein
LICWSEQVWGFTDAYTWLHEFNGTRGPGRHYRFGSDSDDSKITL